MMIHCNNMGTVGIAFATLALSIVVQCQYPITNQAAVKDYPISRMGKYKSISSPISYYYTPRSNRAHERMRSLPPSNEKVIRRRKMKIDKTVPSVTRRQVDNRYFGLQRNLQSARSRSDNVRSIPRQHAHRNNGYHRRQGNQFGYYTPTQTFNQQGFHNKGSQHTQFNQRVPTTPYTWNSYRQQQRWFSTPPQSFNNQYNTVRHFNNKLASAPAHNQRPVTRLNQRQHSVVLNSFTELPIKTKFNDSPLISKAKTTEFSSLSAQTITAKYNNTRNATVKLAKENNENKDGNNVSAEIQSLNTNKEEKKPAPIISPWAREPEPSLFDVEGQDKTSNSNISSTVLGDTKTYYISTTTLSPTVFKITTESPAEETTPLVDETRVKEYKLFMEWLKNNRDEGSGNISLTLPNIQEHGTNEEQPAKTTSTYETPSLNEDDSLTGITEVPPYDPTTKGILEDDYVINENDDGNDNSLGKIFL